MVKFYCLIKYSLSLIILFILSILLSTNTVANPASIQEKLTGLWKFDSARTLKLRMDKGVPWHIGDKYGCRTQAYMRFEGDKYFFYDEKTCELEDSGKVKVVNLNKNEITLRFFPDDNRFNANNLKLKELIRFAGLPGDNVLFLIGFRIIDNDTVETFSLVRSTTKGEMLQRDDNAYWKRIEQLPKGK